MYIHKFQIKNFKSIKDITLYFNKGLNIITGVNNSGKTTVLEALSLWQECFSKLITEARRAEKGYKRGDYVLGPSYNKYFPFNEINSVRSPNFEDIFHQRVKKNTILLALTFIDEENIELCIPFSISSSGSNYVIALDNYAKYDHRAFNDYFANLPNPISLIYSTPVAQISLEEDFVTDPIINEQLLVRKSETVLRNRLYRIINGLDAPLNEAFQNDLNYVLYNHEKKIEFKSETNIQKDAKAIILTRLGAKDVFKDLSLLGSGTLQIIGILLNIHLKSIDKTDANIVLLDEPDSHIHRDIQRRLVDIFNNYGKGLQTFLTTHNESLIRSAAPYQVFHLEGKSTGVVKSIHFNIDAGHLGLHFKGIMPSNLSPVMRSIGNTTGLDFINALEADRLLFVEGEDDAKVFRILLNQQLSRKKYMFWVLGGISEVFENILSYKAVFSGLKNGSTLWDKSVLVFDKDELSNEHKDLFTQKFKEKLGIDTYCANAYTFESTLLTDLKRTSKLLSKLVESTNEKIVSEQDIFDNLTDNYSNYGASLKAKFNDMYLKNAYYRYKNSKVEKAIRVFGQKIINMDEHTFVKYVHSYFEETLAKREYYKLMDKYDVENVIKHTIDKYGINFSIDTDFIETIKLVDKSTWIAEWDFLNKI
ncbi:ATP-dependent nuclease [Haliscomenobacter hydrossis]|uniref:SMC domain protein n=1 Tax=Haliscomenobacter hydrossis (strain ATCC 27775 / DSM 1100 / LMG 10767 / O) TaxID=760192 RepID=F4KVJ5_HALH1|nr:AAA family ATPase [Haliscomenobacter hydrossis]AEE51308.1 SMC domain protein [Haliscomenobacter hydrossis DSM 1100]